ncbi:hypothetical protein [Flavobacterium sp. 245]|uniref:hypothetical protein n=1 Tax=Flavobacterium sp. 245 TaxID=2512115 RepID=UPI00105EA99F|nr:hypothetical protein [Flavobacterium sp. 245]TDO98487.1 hypothetical protein EV145_108121 [Flavobacterium sp. 245]
MKIKKTIFCSYFVLLTVSNAIAKPAPPKPEARMSTTAQASAAGPDLPPGAPIDQNLFVLTGCAVLFGIYAIRRYDFIKKDSI